MPKTRAVIFKEFGGPEVLQYVQDFEIPDRKPGEVRSDGTLMATHACDGLQIVTPLDWSQPPFFVFVVVISVLQSESGLQSLTSALVLQILIRNYSTSVNPVDYKIRSPGAEKRWPGAKLPKATFRNFESP